MSKCDREFLSLCTVPRAVSKEGHTGANASIYIPFAGRRFFNGSSYTYPNATIEQDNSRVMQGVHVPDVYTKGFVRP